MCYRTSPLTAILVSQRLISPIFLKKFLIYIGGFQLRFLFDIFFYRVPVLQLHYQGSAFVDILVFLDAIYVHVHCYSQSKGWAQNY